MNNIFAGMLLVFLNFSIDVDGMSIGLIPSFLGYFFVRRGIDELMEYSEHFRKIRPFAIGAIAYNAVTYVLDITGLSVDVGIWLSIILGILSIALSLYISYNIVMGISDIERDRGLYLYCDKLYSAWKVNAICTILSFGLILLPPLVFVSIIVSFIATIYMLYTLNKTRHEYNASMLL